MTKWLSKLNIHLKEQKTEKKPGWFEKFPAQKKYNLNEYEKFYLSKKKKKFLLQNSFKRLTESFLCSFWKLV